MWIKKKCVCGENNSLMWKFKFGDFKICHASKKKMKENGKRGQNMHIRHNDMFDNIYWM